MTPRFVPTVCGRLLNINFIVCAVRSNGPVRSLYVLTEGSRTISLQGGRPHVMGGSNLFEVHMSDWERIVGECDLLD